MLREELASCDSPKSIDKLVTKIEKLISAGSTEAFSISGRLAYRFREALRHVQSGTFSIMDGRDQLIVRKMFRQAVEQRRVELKAGTDDECLNEATDTVEPEHFTLSESGEYAAHRKKRSPTESQTQGRSQDRNGNRIPTNDIAGRDRHHTQDTARSSPPLPNGISQKQTDFIKAFNKLKDDGYLHSSDLSIALELSGFPSPNPKLVEETIAKICEYSTLSEDQYLQFVEEYTVAVEKMYVEAFIRCDTDHSGTVNVPELGDLLTSIGVVPMDHVLDQVVAEVDMDQSGALDLAEFKNVLEILHSREGFTNEEYKEFVQLFDKWDTDGSGEINAKELLNLLNWLGHVMDSQQVGQVMSAVDSNGSGTMNEREFLLCMRKVREQDLHKIQQVMASNSENGTSTVSRKAIPQVLESLGHVPEMDAVWEAAADAGLAPDLEEFNLSEMWRLLRVYRSRHGFPVAEIDDINNTFMRYDKKNTGEISTLEIGKILRWLGYPTSFEMQQLLCAKVDFDGSGTLSLTELRTLLGMYRATELQSIRQGFQRMDTTQSGFITEEEAWKAFRSIGCRDAKGKVPQASPEERLPQSTSVDGGRIPYLDFTRFSRIALSFLRAARLTFRQNGGFSDKEFEQLKVKFKQYDEDGSGDISNSETIHLLKESFPHMTSEVSMRPKLAHILKEVDADSNGRLDFGDFVRLMVQCNELQQVCWIEREEKAAQETGFAHKEVEDFRDLFLSSGGGHRELSYVSLRKLLGSICPLGDKNASKLLEYLREVTGKASDWTSGSLEFPEFLRLMHNLHTANFAGIRDRYNSKGDRK